MLRELNLGAASGAPGKVPPAVPGNAVSDSAERLEQSGSGRRQLLCSVRLCSRCV